MLVAPLNRRRIAILSSTPVGNGRAARWTTAASPVLTSTRSSATVPPTMFAGGPDHSGGRVDPTSTLLVLGGVVEEAHGAPVCSGAVNAFTVVFGGLLAFFVITVLLLGLFSKRSARDILDWKPTRSPEVELQNELDDVAQMIEAQNELKRRRGAPEITAEEIEARVRDDREQLRRWHES